MSAPLPLESWPQRLDAMLDGGLRIIRRAHVVQTTTSTQDAALSLGLGPGEVVITGRQTAGRGRQGREWADTNDDGVAMTLVIDARPPATLSITCAVGVAMAAESILGAPVGLKWPNDVYVRGRKLAGILVEQSSGLASGLAGGLARIGIGVNVNQTSWAAEIADHAISLRQVRGGEPLERLEVIETLLSCLNEALGTPLVEVEAAFCERDTLVGKVASFTVASGDGWETLTGEVVELEPTRGLAVRISGGDERRWLPAATTSVTGFG